MSLFNLTKTYKGDVPPKTTTAVYCGAGAFRDACYQLVSAFLITYITFSGLLSVDNPTEYLAQMGVISAIMVICRIWDGMNDPIMGWIIEKFHFKWGKYKPWILIGGIANTIVVLTLFLAHPTGWGFVVLFGIFYFLWDLAWTINDIAYWSMLPSLTKDEQRRNNISSIMQVCISIGIFAIYGAVTLLVGNVSTGASAQATYGTIAIVVTALYLLSQILICVMCKEHVRDEEAEKKEIEDVHFKDMFLLFKKNDQFRVNVIAILLHYLASGVIVGFGMYYCYIAYGYGTGEGATGGTVSFMITVMYAIGTLISQSLYPILAKKLNRKKMYCLAGIFIILGYVMFLVTGFPLFGDKPLAYGGNEYLVYISSALLFFGQGIIAVATVIQMQSTIEYNEWKYGERKEAIVSSMRALVAKWGSAIQQGLIYATLSLTGLYALTQEISNYENVKNAFDPALYSDKIQQAYDAMQSTLQGATASQMVGMSVGMIIIPLIIYMVCIFLSTKVFKIDEKMYKQICDDLNSREAKK